MFSILEGQDRGPTDAGWLKSQHSFSFGSYYNPGRMGFGPLRVINEDRVIGGAGFGTHPHANMEIISYVLEGALSHRDSMGNGSTIRPGDIQIMSAGSGLTHSEFNGSSQDEVHFLQIWIMPNTQNEKPNYQQKSLEPQEMKNQLRLVISPEGENGTLTIRQDARMYVGHLEAGNTVTLPLNPERRTWIQIAKGLATVNDQAVRNGDGVGVIDEKLLTITAETDAEVIVFDLP